MSHLGRLQTGDACLAQNTTQTSKSGRMKEKVPKYSSGNEVDDGDMNVLARTTVCTSLRISPE